MKGYRTVAFNTLMALVAMLSAFGVIEPAEVPGADVLNSFLDNLESVIIGVTSVVNIVLRVATTGPVGTKE